MRIDEAGFYVCPKCKQTMDLEIRSQEKAAVNHGVFVCPEGDRYEVRDGLPDFTYPFVTPESDVYAKNWYDANADVYDEYLPLTFATFNEDEQEVREAMIDKLNLRPGHKVLEVGAGSGRDSVLIANRLKGEGQLFLQDLSYSILRKSFPKMEQVAPLTAYHLGNACNLPFPDRCFDAAFHFGGLNTFSDISAALQEMNRVTKLGGKVVVGDESMPVWLRDTEFGKILMNSNPHYRYDPPLPHLPISCRKVRIEWIIGGVFYVLDYEVGEGAPSADFDFEIPGPRGGTHRTRYHGRLEGVTPETKELAARAREKTGKSMHKWLDDAVRKAAMEELRS